eukprot:TRINITY_DN9776_c0_g1_i2.p1 TRINITY_DN9776_c0_g1~~TRINITY_DN9776_c0_g1_i2.p1  ORF type:complete len:151 (-),score=27.02 TRINITY_DN9776_c0_g1_i2:902-1354(-)
MLFIQIKNNGSSGINAEYFFFFFFFFFGKNKRLLSVYFVLRKKEKIPKTSKILVFSTLSRFWYFLIKSHKAEFLVFLDRTFGCSFDLWCFEEDVDFLDLVCSFCFSSSDNEDDVVLDLDEEHEDFENRNPFLSSIVLLDMKQSFTTCLRP